MLKNKQHDGNPMDRVIIISEPDPYVLLNHLKEPISRIIEGDIEDGEPVVFYDKKTNETYVFSYLYVTSDRDNTSGLKTLSMLIDPSSTLLFPSTKNLTMLKLAIKSKKLLDKQMNLNPLQIIDELSGEFDNPIEVMFTISNPIYSVSRIWYSDIVLSSELLFDQILDFLKVIFDYHKNGLNKAIETFSAFCMDILVHHKRAIPEIQNNIIIISQDLPDNPIIKSFDIILSGQESLHPIIIINYSSLHYEAFIPISINPKRKHPLSSLHIGDISIFLSRMFHYGVVYQISSKIAKAVESFIYGKALKARITKIETSNIHMDLQNLLIGKYGIREN